MDRQQARATRLLTLFLVAVVTVLCAQIRISAPAPSPSSGATTPLAAAVAATPRSGVQATPRSGVQATPRSGVQAASFAALRIDALTVGLIDDRPRPALPQTSDLAAIRTVAGSASDGALRPAGLVDTHPATSRTIWNDEIVTGDAVAFGAPDAGSHGGIGSATLSGSGSGSSTTATLSGLSELAVHAGFTVARTTTRTGTIHTSVQPLDRPG